MAAVSDEVYKTVVNLKQQQAAITKNISDGKSAAPLYDKDDSVNQLNALKGAMSELRVCITDDKQPKFINEYTMKDLACIAYNPDSNFAKKKQKQPPKDTWWTHLVANYNFSGINIPHNVV